MIKIGIIGSDNSHAYRFSKLINIDKIFKNVCTVNCIYGLDEKETKFIAKKTKIKFICKDIHELIDHVNAVLIVDRHGDRHLNHALPFIKKKIPTFVDKPLAINLNDCEKIINESQKYDTPFTSFSPLRVSPSIEIINNKKKDIGDLTITNYTGPCDFNSIYGGPFFYATHLYEIARITICDNLLKLSSYEINGIIYVNIIWESGLVTKFSYLNNSYYVFYTSMFGSKGYISEEIIGGDSCYRNLLKSFLDMITYNTKPLSDYELIEPIKFVNIMQESLKKNGKFIKFN